jgi:hypothetical protein
MREIKKLEFSHIWKYVFQIKEIKNVFQIKEAYAPR